MYIIIVLFTCNEIKKLLFTDVVVLTVMHEYIDCYQWIVSKDSFVQWVTICRWVVIFKVLNFANLSK